MGEDSAKKMKMMMSTIIEIASKAMAVMRRMPATPPPISKKDLFCGGGEDSSDPSAGVGVSVIGFSTI